MVRVLSDDDVAALLDLDELLPVVADAFEKQRRGEVERPERPHFPVGTGLDAGDPAAAAGTALTMPAYVHGADHYATKLASVHEDNPERGLPTVNAGIAVTEAATGLPAAFAAGTRITNARTGCIGGLAVRELAGEGPLTVAVFGAGQQARWQSRAIATVADVADLRVYSPNTREECAADLRERGIEARAVGSPPEAIEGADVVVTATTSTEPVFDGADLDPGTLIVAVGAYTGEMCELDATTVERAGRIYADVPEEVIEVGDLRDRVAASAIAPLASAFDADAVGSEAVVLVESVGTAVLDAAAAEHLLERARAAGVGTEVDL